MDEGSNEGCGERAAKPPEAGKTAPANETAAAAAPADTAPQQAAAANARRLPIVWSPSLDAGEESAEDDADAEAASSASMDGAANEVPRAAAAAPARSSRFVLLAASVAAAAAFGSFVGALSASGLVHLWTAASPRPAVLAYVPQAGRTQRAEFAALKASVDNASRGANGQFAKLADRLDRLERAQSEPAAKLAHMADILDRLDRRNTSAAADVTGAIPPSSPTKPAQKVLQDWIVHGVQDGRAFIESRYGGLYDVATGSILPGLGRVEAIKRQDGEWVVVTARGIITSGR